MSLQQNSIKILGAYGNKYKNFNTTSLQLTDKVLIDAGNVMQPLKEKAKEIEHIFLTHAHFDHLVDLPFLIETFFELRTKTLNIYATKETIEILQKNIFNNQVWPNFTQINLLNKEQALKFHRINVNQILKIDGVTIKAVENNHSIGSCGYIFTKNKNTFLFTSDTYLSQSLIDEINNNLNINNLIIETSFPSNYEKLAKISKHLTPKLLKRFLQKINRKLNIYIHHIKPIYKSEIIKELKELDIKARILDDNDIIYLKDKDE